MAKNDDKPPFDLQKAYRWLAGDAFNRTWELINKPSRTAEEIEEMIHRAHASRWLWGQFTGVTGQNLAVGDWQLARVYALANRSEEARRYAKLGLDRAIECKLVPFYIGYAYESMARAELVAGDVAAFDRYLALAWEQHGKMIKPEAQKLLEADLKQLETLRKQVAAANA